MVERTEVHFDLMMRTRKKGGRPPLFHVVW